MRRWSTHVTTVNMPVSISGASSAVDRNIYIITKKGGGVLIKEITLGIMFAISKFFFQSLIIYKIKWLEVCIEQTCYDDGNNP